MRESVKQTNAVNKLTPIKEEDEWDMLMDNKPRVYAINASLRKKMLGRRRRYKSKQDKINQIMKRGQGIHRAVSKCRMMEELMGLSPIKGRC